MPSKVLSLSMVLHELITNATKYGALSASDGRIAVSWDWSTADRPERVRFTWKESGLSGIVPPTRQGFGPQDDRPERGARAWRRVRVGMAG
jgi:two-component sensor histidine kinase